MPSTNLTGKTKADLVVLAELSGLLTATNARKMTKDQLLKFLSEAEKNPNEEKKTKTEKKSTSGSSVQSTKTKQVKSEAKPRKTSAKKVEAEEASIKAEAATAKTDEAATAKPDAATAKTDDAATAKPDAVIGSPEADSSPTEAQAEPKPKTAESRQTRGRPAKATAKTRSTRARSVASDNVNKKTENSENKKTDKTSEGEKTETVKSLEDVSGSQKSDQPKKSTRGRRSVIRSEGSDTDKQTVGKKKQSAQSTQEKHQEQSAQPTQDTKQEQSAQQDQSTQKNQTAQPVQAPNQDQTAQPVQAPNQDQSAQQVQVQLKDQNIQTVQEAQQEQSVQSDQNPQQDQTGHKQNVQPNPNGQRNAAQINKQKRPIVEQGEPVAGTLEIMADGYGFLRKDNYLQGTKDIYVPPQYIRRFNLKTGDYITGPGKLQRENDRYQALLYVKDVNGMPPDKMLRRPQFDRLTPIYPDERYRLETTRNELSTRIIDLAAPIGKGQRGMIVSPPKAGKTILLQKIANAISVNNPEVKLIVLLIDERPEEVTDMQRSIKGEVVYSTFDKTPENHVKVTELVLERAMRLVELKQDVVILLDSMTRLARAYNLTINPTGRTLSGGLDPGALYGPKRFFGAARNIENGGSLTIIATSLIETGSRMDEVIFEEFKGTGNMEVYLDRKLSEKRIFPAIDINRSGTRREELLMTEKELDAVWSIRKAFSQLDTSAVTETIINLLLKTQNNEHFISSINVSFNDKSIFEAMRGNRPAGNGQQNQNTMNNGSAR